MMPPPLTEEGRVRACRSLAEEEHPIVVSADARPSDIVELIISRLEINHGSKRAKSPMPITALVADPTE
jgi:hypothetical protein